ncbi:hypothetical protein J3D47_002837 [Pseudomonas laurylsulfativorans]|uniref:hypothetical protein n=1 Tax=Pseudomonas laurylsulfativorans TaxID=1943631 RepID=UPI0020A13E51|nr:hypothetical protein [Pseudomonas laurylsulfativorans]MCP1418594.1 hypothetical protein [Pseudomonas laurylsulfativorans]
MKDEVVTVKVDLGGAVVDLINNSSLKFSVDCLAAVSMCWYEIDRGSKGQSLIDVSVGRSGHGLLIKNVVSLSFVVDELETKEVENLTVTLRGLPDNSSHEENKKIIYALISDLKAAGWQKYYFPSDPRISSLELKKFNWSDNVFGATPLSHPLFDVNHEMSLSDWLANRFFYDWYMYSGDYIAHVAVQRRNTPSDPTRAGIYLISVKFMSFDGFWRTDFDEAVRPKWKQLFLSHLQQLIDRRFKVEARARAAGVSIDETYNPPSMERAE